MSDWIDELFETLENDEDEPCSVITLSYIESLIKMANLSQQEKDTFVYLEELTNKEAKEMIEYLFKNQIDKINSGAGYSQTDIKFKIKREIL